jgi:hypothetical protein
MKVDDVLQHKEGLELDAWWYRSGVRRPPRSAPSKRIERLERIIGSASRCEQALKLEATGLQEVAAKALLAALYVNSDDAYDGVGDNSKGWELFEALASVEPYDEDLVSNAIRTIAFSADLSEKITSVREIRHRTLAVAAYINETEIDPSGICKEPIGNQSDTALNDWLASTVVRYESITGKPAGTSVGGPESEQEGIARGPLIRFLMALGPRLRAAASSAGQPQHERRRIKRHFHLLQSEDALRRRNRRLKKTQDTN